MVLGHNYEGFSELLSKRFLQRLLNEEFLLQNWPNASSKKIVLNYTKLLFEMSIALNIESKLFDLKQYFGSKVWMPEKRKLTQNNLTASLSPPQSFTQTGTNFQLYWDPMILNPAQLTLHSFNNIDPYGNGCDLTKEQGKVSAHFFMTNLLCSLFKFRVWNSKDPIMICGWSVRPN